MANVSDIYGEISIHDKQTLKPNYTKFKENDLIWAKITPCMENGKSAIASNLENGFGFGSTEFHVLRAKNKDFSIHYATFAFAYQPFKKNGDSVFYRFSRSATSSKIIFESLNSACFKPRG